jgi:hypothetical protein
MSTQKCLQTILAWLAERGIVAGQRVDIRDLESVYDEREFDWPTFEDALQQSKPRGAWFIRAAFSF